MYVVLYVCSCALFCMCVHVRCFVCVFMCVQIVCACVCFLKILFSTFMNVSVFFYYHLDVFVCFHLRVCILWYQRPSINIPLKRLSTLCDYQQIHASQYIKHHPALKAEQMKK